MNESKTFIENLNIYDGNITYNDFDIDERIPFDEQKYSYKMDILQITFGPRYILDRKTDLVRAQDLTPLFDGFIKDNMR